MVSSVCQSCFKTRGSTILSFGVITLNVELWCGRDGYLQGRFCHCRWHGLFWCVSWSSAGENNYLTLHTTSTFTMYSSACQLHIQYHELNEQLLGLHAHTHTTVMFCSSVYCNICCVEVVAKTRTCASPSCFLCTNTG